MNPGNANAAPRPNAGHWIALVSCALLLALALLRPPLAVSPAPDRSYQTVLYETLRLGRAWGADLVTTDGPLAAVQAPGYLRGSVWMAMSWQIAGNLLLAAFLTGAAFRLSRPRRWWALAFLGIVLGRYPTLAPWLVMVLAGHDLIDRWDREPLAVLPLAAVLGFLALSSLGHLLLGLFAVGFMLATPRPPAAKAAAAGGFVAAFAGGWLALVQPPGGLGLWLFRALPALWSTSPLGRHADLAPVLPWVGAGCLALIITVARSAPSGGRRWSAGVVFLLVSLWLAWKTIALQPFGLSALFFSMFPLIGFVLMHRGMHPGWTGLICGIGASALIQVNPLLLSNGLGHLNQQIHTNCRLLGALPGLRPALQAEVGALRPIYKLPRIQAAVGEASIGLVGLPPGRALLNDLNVQLPPVPMDELLRTPALAALNGARWAGAGAPAFVLQGLQSEGDSPPALLDGPIQRILHQRYELLLEEAGHVLWRLKPGNPAPPAPVLIAEGTLHRGEALRLPQSDGTSYWLELHAIPNLVGRLWSAVHDLDVPGLVVRDAGGISLRYALPASAAAGFIVQPFTRGEVDFIRRHSGQAAARTTEIALAAPPRRGWGWKSRAAYRLYALPGAGPDGHRLPADTLQRYRTINRLPVGVGHEFPFEVFSDVPNAPVLFSHPPSLLEFIVTGGDRRVRGSYGILPGAYEGAATTDGVDFSIEYAGPDGIRRTLHRRHLDPASEPADRGLQEFNVNLPASPGARLLLRTYNTGSRSAAWDWAFWRGIVIE